MSGNSNLAEERASLPAALKNWGDRPNATSLKQNVIVDCGWGRLLFGQTFASAQSLADELAGEKRGERDVAFYVHEPHVAVAEAPQRLFLDPSHSYRLDLTAASKLKVDPGRTIRDATPGDLSEINRIYLGRGMAPIRDDYLNSDIKPHSVTVLVLEDPGSSGRIVGVVMGIDHIKAFDDPELGSSLWALAVDEQTPYSGLGRSLVGELANRFRSAGVATMDLSVMHDNESAIALYERVGFKQVPIYCVKKKNPINEALYIGPVPDSKLNPYARIIIDEARRRGIIVEVEDAEAGMFRLINGGRTISCRESLSDLTSAVALSRCDDKSLTRRLLKRNGIDVPDQITVGNKKELTEFVARHRRVVVKPARGEQGRAVSVDLQSENEIADAIEEARAVDRNVLVEQFVEGEDLRVIVIDGKVVAGAIRRPAIIVGDGESTIGDLIGKQSRRRQRATQGESSIPLDDETTRTVQCAGYSMSDVLAPGKELYVRRAANLHTGGTIHDVTDQLSEKIRNVAIHAAHILNIPVVGFDFIVPDVTSHDYVIIEANERPGLANHEPQPTAQCFVDLLFPETKDKITQASAAEK